MKLKYIKNIIILLILLFTIVSCLDDRAPSGITGYIKFGSGNCSNPEVSPVYHLYNGYVWFVNKTIIDTMTQFNIDTNASWFVKTKVNNGLYGLMIPPGTYQVFIDSLVQLQNNQTVVIKSDLLLQKNFNFYKCN
jgi:hypothetical protein